jgi:tetratricopeptide (TPR) repeat protein
MSVDEKLESAFEYYNQGNLSKAESIFKEILHVQPDNTEVLYFLAEISYRLGNYDSAMHYIRNALQYDTTNAEAYNNLGFILQRKGQCDDAIQCYQRAIQLNPDLPGAHSNLGNVLKEKGQFDEAIRCYQSALQLNPDLAEAYSNLGLTFKKAGRFDEAIDYCQKAVERDPHDANMYYNLGIVFQEKGQLDEAIACYQKASQLDPRDAQVYNNLAFALQENRRPYEAIPYYQKALQLNPDYATAHWNLSLALLLTGNFREGWKEYEWRWETQYLISSRRNFKQPLWDGSDIKGRTILLHAEQGFGDTVQFIRYAPLVAERGAHVIFECHKDLASLLQSVEGIAEVVVRGEELPEFDVQCPLLSLPLAFHTTLQTIPVKVPYIASDTALIRKWKDKIERDGSRMKVGVVWAGNPGFRQNRYRNIPLERFSTLAQIPGVTLYSIQKGEEAKETKNPPGNMNIIDYTEDIRDFSDTASLIENLDLVISIDSAVAHLAGALGKLTWTLLPFSPEWRWLLNREDSPWYPTMRLFRQPSLGNWEPVIEYVKKELHEVTDKFLTLPWNNH